VILQPVSGLLIETRDKICKQVSGKSKRGNLKMNEAARKVEEVKATRKFWYKAGRKDSKMTLDSTDAAMQWTRQRKYRGVGVGIGVEKAVNHSLSL
jgi:hypothetical protein